MRESPQWLNEVVDQTGLDQRTAVQVVRAVLQALRDELTVGQNEHLRAQIPVAFRYLYFMNWKPGARRRAVRDVAPFLRRVRENLGKSASRADLEKIVPVALSVLERHMFGSAEKIRPEMPKHLRALWPSSIAEETLERHGNLTAQKRAALKQALHAESGRERGAPMAPHQNRAPGAEHRGGPLPNRM